LAKIAERELEVLDLKAQVIVRAREAGFGKK
jgi:hypothetical protein